MSSFIIPSACINSIVTYMEFHNYAFGWLKRRYGFDITDPADRRRLAESLYLLNCAAFSERYEEDPAEKDLPAQRPFVYRRVILPAVSTFKAALCLHCECSGGSVREQPLFEALERIVGIIAITIVESLPEYQKTRRGNRTTAIQEKNLVKKSQL